jgi:hypothetical protein
LETAPRAQLVRIDGPHLLLQTRPVECAAAVTEFVRTCAQFPGSQKLTSPL